MDCAVVKEVTMSDLPFSLRTCVYLESQTSVYESADSLRSMSLTRLAQVCFNFLVLVLSTQLGESGSCIVAVIHLDIKSDD